MLQRQLRGIFTILDDCYFQVSEFEMLPGFGQGYWSRAIRDDFVNLTNGFVISDKNLNKTYKNDSFVVYLRSNVIWDQISEVAVWDSSMASDYTHILLQNPSNEWESFTQALAPSGDADGDSDSDNRSGSTNPSRLKKSKFGQPKMLENCKMLSLMRRIW